jgi:omega-6 fatty acid desaturase (delta-12 desaturase)
MTTSDFTTTEVRPTSPETSHRVITATQPFARANDRLAAWQVLSTMAVFMGCLALVGSAGSSPWRWLLIVPLIGLAVRLFVLQHDCGHQSLFGSRRVNDTVGTLLSFISGVAYEAWRSEHNWHHGNQGKLSHRGVDRMNSPMTVGEATATPANAVLRDRKISILSIFCLGAVSLVLLRKRHTGFFQFREKFRWPIRNREALIRSVRVTNTGHALFHLGVIAWLGPLNWATVLLPVIVAGAGCGSLLFWIQHNFEHTHHADDATWAFVDAGLKGSSYLRLPGVLKWATGNIGIHHVHHVNSRIPNYHLEAARRAVPELAAVAPLTVADFRKCFTHVFWDESGRRMVSYADVFAATS